MSDAVWLAIIGVFAMALKEYFDHRRASRVAGKVEEVALTTAQVKAKVKAADDRNVEKMDALAESVVLVQKATNGLKEELVAEVRAASFAEGVKSETDKRPPKPQPQQQPPKP